MTSEKTTRIVKAVLRASEHRAFAVAAAQAAQGKREFLRQVILDRIATSHKPARCPACGK